MSESLAGSKIGQKRREQKEKEAKAALATPFQVGIEEIDEFSPGSLPADAKELSSWRHIHKWLSWVLIWTRGNKRIDEKIKTFESELKQTQEKVVKLDGEILNNKYKIETYKKTSRADVLIKSAKTIIENLEEQKTKLLVEQDKIINTKIKNILEKRNSGNSKLYDLFHETIENLETNITNINQAIETLNIAITVDKELKQKKPEEGQVATSLDDQLKEYVKLIKETTEQLGDPYKWKFLFLHWKNKQPKQLKESLEILKNKKYEIETEIKKLTDLEENREKRFGELNGQLEGFQKKLKEYKKEQDKFVTKDVDEYLKSLEPKDKEVAAETVEAVAEETQEEQLEKINRHYIKTGHPTISLEQAIEEGLIEKKTAEPIPVKERFLVHAQAWNHYIDNLTEEELELINQDMGDKKVSKESFKVGENYIKVLKEEEKNSDRHLKDERYILIHEFKNQLKDNLRLQLKHKSKDEGKKIPDYILERAFEGFILVESEIIEARKSKKGTGHTRSKEIKGGKKMPEIKKPELPTADTVPPSHDSILEKTEMEKKWDIVEIILQVIAESSPRTQEKTIISGYMNKFSEDQKTLFMNNKSQILDRVKFEKEKRGINPKPTPKDPKNQPNNQPQKSNIGPNNPKDTMETEEEAMWRTYNSEKTAIEEKPTTDEGGADLKIEKEIDPDVNEGVENLELAEEEIYEQQKEEKGWMVEYKKATNLKDQVSAFNQYMRFNISGAIGTKNALQIDYVAFVNAPNLKDGVKLADLIFRQNLKAFFEKKIKNNKNNKKNDEANELKDVKIETIEAKIDGFFEDVKK